MTNTYKTTKRPRQKYASITFRVTITREYMLINGFEEDATLAAVEAWADKQTALGGESA